MKVIVMMDQKLMRRTMIFTHTKTMPLTKKIPLKRIKSLKIGNRNLSQTIWKFLIYLMIMMVPMGWRQVWRKTFLLLLSDFFLYKD